MELIRPFLSCRGLQPIGLICHAEAFQVTMAVDENPSEVTDFPVLPSANPACASHICPLRPMGFRCPSIDPRMNKSGQPVEVYWRNQPITLTANTTSSLVGDQFTQALNLPIGGNGKHCLVFVFAVGYGIILVQLNLTLCSRICLSRWKGGSCFGIACLISSPSATARSRSSRNAGVVRSEYTLPNSFQG